MAITDIKPSTKAADQKYLSQKADLSKTLQSMDANDATLSAKYDELMGSASKVARDMSEGKIPDDVQKMVKQAAGERALSRGLGSGSQASSFMTARDLGKTSLDIAQAGASLSTNLAQVYEARRQANQQYSTNIRNLLDQTRRTDIAATEMNEGSRRFNVEAELKYNELLANVLGTYHQIGASLTTSGADGKSSSMSALSKDFGGLLTRIRAL